VLRILDRIDSLANELERIDRERRSVERRIRLARFPQTKSFDTFDFTANRR
jgi:DNA replication protein DnaC